ncbi:hypothetical protein J2847_001282 [Azospirillum agricola]|uniref:GFA family protein n=1 Tax=Azospirillum agricola TaxID=1720247 RepID=UPI001AE9806C|nr:GFA family protein [Azospirillum agricola]MBP2228000.1 hypothetical protein [Azospirillum agricola]
MKGSCFCGGVSFEIRGEIPDLYQCHCSLCRKVTGAAANAAFVVPASDFAWRSGEDIVRTFVRDSGYRVDFCSVCGSNVPNPTRTGESVWVPAGLLDEPTTSRVVRHNFVGSKAEWDEIGGSAVQHVGAAPAVDPMPS